MELMFLCSLFNFFLTGFHLKGKEDFERQQKELLEKENIIKQTAVQLGQEQVRPRRKRHTNLENKWGFVMQKSHFASFYISIWISAASNKKKKHPLGFWQ